MTASLFVGMYSPVEFANRRGAKREKNTSVFSLPPPSLFFSFRRQREQMFFSAFVFFSSLACAHLFINMSLSRDFAAGVSIGCEIVLVLLLSATY